MENPFRKISREQKRSEKNEFLHHIIAQVNDHSFSEIETQIAERKFREPIRIIGEIHLMPFWREGKEAPPLPNSKIINPYRGHW